MNLTTSCYIAIGVFLLGLFIVSYGIIVEDEPTALGLATTLLGSIGLINRCRRQKRTLQSSKEG
jgi:xanthine/uracil/vitamin C permease (AzgA family)